MKTYERISQLEKLGLEVEEYKCHIAKKWLRFATSIAKFTDGAEEFELNDREGVIRLPKRRIYLPKHYRNVTMFSKDRNIYLNILRLEGIDISRLEDKTIYCRGHVIWQPDIFHYFRLPTQGYLDSQYPPERIR
jgi:hypothetical protein